MTQASKLQKPHLSSLKHKEEMIRPEAILIFEESPQLIQKVTFPTTLLQILSPPSFPVP
jgi:hypothetical protein